MKSYAARCLRHTKKPVVEKRSTPSGMESTSWTLNSLLGYLTYMHSCTCLVSDYPAKACDYIYYVLHTCKMQNSILIYNNRYCLSKWLLKLEAAASVYNYTKNVLENRVVSKDKLCKRARQSLITSHLDSVKSIRSTWAKS